MKNHKEGDAFVFSSVQTTHPHKKKHEKIEETENFRHKRKYMKRKKII